MKFQISKKYILTSISAEHKSKAPLSPASCLIDGLHSLDF